MSPNALAKVTNFDGGLIERLDAERCKLYCKVECGVYRFALRKVDEFDSLPDGARVYAVRFFGTSFDGMLIDSTLASRSRMSPGEACLTALPL